MDNYSIAKVAYDRGHKIIGIHPDGRRFATRANDTNGLYLVDRDLILLANVYPQFPGHITNCIFLSTGTMIAWGIYVSGQTTKIYRSNDLTYTSFSVVLEMETDKRLIENSLAVSEDETIMCCEYSNVGALVYGLNRIPANNGIWKATNDGRDWEKIIDYNRNPQFTGDKDVIRHFHTVAYDKYADKFWITAGDGLTNASSGATVDERYGFENKIWNINPDGTEFTEIGNGSQRWRTTGLAFTPDYVIWGTDSNHLSSSYFRRYDRITGVDEDVLKNNDCVRTMKTLETKWGELFVANKSYEAGPENPDNDIQLFISDDSSSWKSIYTWEAPGGLSSVFYNFISDGIDRIYGTIKRIITDDGITYITYTTSVVIDIAGPLIEEPEDPEEPGIESVGNVSIFIANKPERLPLYPVENEQIRIMSNGKIKAFKLVDTDDEKSSNLRVRINGVTKALSRY